MWQSPRVPFAKNRVDQRIHYRLIGDAGPPVVLLMGIGVSSRFWLGLPERLALDREKPRRVLTIDNRGTGESERPTKPFGMAGMADDVAAVLDHAEIAQADVVGMSLGGMIAQEVALRHPERVRHLSLLCTTPGLPLGKLPQPRALALLVQGFASGMNTREFELLMVPEARVDEARRARRAEDWKSIMRNERFDARTLLLHLLAASAHSTGSKLGRIRAPTRVVSGADDLLIPADNSRRLARAIPGASLELLPDVGHDILALDPNCVARQLARLEEG